MVVLANALAWSVSSAAMADWIAHGAADVVAAGADDNTSKTAHHGSTRQACNHGCHALSHLQGQVSRPLALYVPIATEIAIEDISAPSPLAISEGLFRPPRSFSQA